jgi:RNA polymerase sigma factor, sigma-70 family
LCNEDDINEAVQETMIEAYKEIKKLKYNQYFKTWIIKILINKCNKQYRKNKKENISYEYNNLENQIKENEIQTDIDFYIIISKLEYVERIIVTLYYLERYTTKEIAKILNKNENTIKTKLSRAKKKLRRYLEEEN